MASNKYSCGKPRIATVGGSASDAQIDASDMIRLNASTTAKAISANRIASGEIASQTPSAAAGPCDSRNRETGGSRDEHRDCALEDVAGEGHQRCAHAARAYDVGGPDIAGADRARIEAADAADDHSGRNRADDVSDEYYESLKHEDRSGLRD
jgi:hypothetical protein